MLGADDPGKGLQRFGRQERMRDRWLDRGRLCENGRASRAENVDVSFRPANGLRPEPGRAKKREELIGVEPGDERTHLLVGQGEKAVGQLSELGCRPEGFPEKRQPSPSL